MTEAKSPSWKCEGVKADFRIEACGALCVADDVAGNAAEEILEVAPREGFGMPILRGISSHVYGTSTMSQRQIRGQFSDSSHL